MATEQGDSAVNTRLESDSTQFQRLYMASYDNHQSYLIFTTQELSIYDDLNQIPKSVAEFRDKFDVNEDNVVTIPSTPIGLYSESSMQDYLPSHSRKKIKTQYNYYLGNQRKLKYFQSPGYNKIAGSTRQIGPMFSYDDFVAAEIPEKYVMPIARCLDPFAELVKRNVTPIEGEMLFKDFFHLRPQTWLSESSTKLFVDYV